jgi:hypothetical protein
MNTWTKRAFRNLVLQRIRLDLLALTAMQLTTINAVPRLTSENVIRMCPTYNTIQYNTIYYARQPIQAERALVTNVYIRTIYDVCPRFPKPIFCDIDPQACTRPSFAP